MHTVFAIIVAGILGTSTTVRFDQTKQRIEAAPRKSMQSLPVDAPYQDPNIAHKASALQRELEQVTVAGTAHQTISLHGNLTDRLRTAKRKLRRTMRRQDRNEQSENQAS